MCYTKGIYKSEYEKHDMIWYRHKNNFTHTHNMCWVNIAGTCDSILNNGSEMSGIPAAAISPPPIHEIITSSRRGREMSIY